MKKLSLLLILWLPIFYLLLLSFNAFYKYPIILPSKFTFVYWYDVLIKNPLFYKALLSSLLLALSSATLSTLFGFMTGRAVVYHLNGYNKRVALAIAIPLMIPGMIMFLGMHQILIHTPLVNSFVGVVLAHTTICLPYTSNIAIAYFTGIPSEYEAVSKTLGSSPFTSFRKVILPLISPGIMTAMSISFLISNTEYFSTFLIGGGKVISLSLLMFPYITNADYGHTAVMGIVFILLHVGLFYIMNRRLNKGITESFYGGN